MMRYRIQVPSAPPTSTGYALWLYLHGAFATAEQGEAVFGNLAEVQGAILLSPQATRPCEDGYCWSFANDVQAIAQLLNQIMTNYPINFQRVSLIGYSMGCTMGLWLLTQNPGIFAVFVALGMGSVFEPWEHDDGGIDRASLQRSASFTRVLLAVDQHDPAGTNAYFESNLACLQAAGFQVTTMRPAEGTHSITEVMKTAVVKYLAA